MVKDMFDMNRCWMLGAQNNRWLFVAIELTILAHQFDAFKKGRSTWDIKKNRCWDELPASSNNQFSGFLTRAIYTEYIVLSNGVTRSSKSAIKFKIGEISSEIENTIICNVLVN